jgi:hypothetical protein
MRTLLGGAAMMRVELTNEEAAFLRRVLELEGSELGMEISATDTLRLREALKRDKALLQGLLLKLREPVVA